MLAVEVTDDRLPALAAFREEGLATVLERNGVAAPDGLRVLKHHPGQRCTMRVETAGGPLVVKAYAEAPHALVTVMRAFARAGLADGHGPSVPPLLAYDAALSFTVTAVFGGRAMREMIRDGDGEQAGALAAAWLRAASRASLRIGVAHDPRTLIDESVRWGPTIEGAGAAVAAQAARLVDVLAASPPGSGRAVLLHGSFSPSHVIELADGPGVIDLDTIGYGPAELDAAMMLASLSRLAGGRPRHARAIADAARRFRSDLGDIVSEPVLGWYRAGLLLKLAARTAARQPHDWETRAQALVAEAALVVGSL